MLLFHDWFPVKFEFIHIQYFFGMVRNKITHRRCSVGKAVLRNFAKFLGKHLCQSLFLNKVAGLRKKETLTRVFPCEFCEIFKNTFFTKHIWTTASWKINSKHKISTRVNQKKNKSSRKGYIMWKCFKFWPMENIFRKLWANESLIMACVQIYRNLIHQLIHLSWSFFFIKLQAFHLQFYY